MEISSWKRGIVFGIIVLFVGASIVPIIAGDVNVDGSRKNVMPDTIKNRSFTAKNSALNQGISESKFNLYLPPYYSSGGEKDDWGSGLSSSHDAQWYARHLTGRLRTKGKASATRNFATATAQSEAWITGPKEEKFQFEKSGQHFVFMVFLLNGEARTKAKLGSLASAESLIKLNGSLYDYDTNDCVGSYSRMLYHQWHTFQKDWFFRIFFVAFTVNISNDHFYYFKSQLYTKHQVSAGLSEDVEGSSDLTARLCMVFFFPVA